MKHIILIGIASFLFAIIDSGCKKLVEVSPPPTSITSASDFTSDATAIATVTSIYTKISAANLLNPGPILSLSMYAGLSADEFGLWSGAYRNNPKLLAYYQNALSANLGYGSEYWNTIYPYIFSCNSAIEGLNNSSGLTPAIKQQLLGEAKYMRALFYFYLVNLYGGVPLALSSDYTLNSKLGRSTVSAVYLQIVGDLHDAEHLLSVNFLDATLLNSSGDRVRPTSWAAAALLARAYLYTQNWAGADSAATVVINNPGTFKLSSLDTAFLRASINNTIVNEEAIWQLQPVNTAPNNTYDALAFIIPSAGLGSASSFGVYLSNNLMNSFEAGDNRKTHWVHGTTISGTTYYYAYKYKVNSKNTATPVTEYYMLLRLGEQYLIRAEARANEGNISGAQSDLNIIRARAGLAGTTANTQATLIAALLHERQVELFTELGQRWFDLKRSGTVDTTMNAFSAQKAGATWSSYQQLYPVKIGDIQLDPNLTQNTGY